MLLMKFLINQSIIEKFILSTAKARFLYVNNLPEKDKFR